MSDSVIYPVFLECTTYTLDEYWKRIFTDCSRNKFPSGLMFDGKVLYISSSCEKVDLPSIPRNIYVLLMKIFRSDLGLVSTRDINVVAPKTIVDISDVEWKKLPKNVKASLKNKYIKRLEKKYSLNQKEVKGIYQDQHI